MPLENLVHVIDDDDAMRDSLAFLLRSAKVEARTYESALAFLDTVNEISGGCIVTDVRMPDMTGMELIRRLQELKITLPIIVITGHGDVPLAVEAMKCGAADFIEKPFDDDLFLAAVRSALNVQAADQERQAARSAIDARLALLSPRERDVLEGLVAGQPNKIIAYELGISPRTVEIYRANVMTKMEAASLSELVRMALTGGVIALAPNDKPKPR